MSTNAELYEEDFYAWTQTTAALIREGKWHDLDREAVAEEIESLGKSDWRELASRISVTKIDQSHLSEIESLIENISIHCSPPRGETASSEELS